MHKLLSWVRELAPILGVNKCDVGMYISMIHLDYIIRYICICLHVCVYMYILNESVIYIYYTLYSCSSQCSVAQEHKSAAALTAEPNIVGRFRMCRRLRRTVKSN